MKTISTMTNRKQERRKGIQIKVLQSEENIGILRNKILWYSVFCQNKDVSVVNISAFSNNQFLILTAINIHDCLPFYTQTFSTLFRMGSLGIAHGWGGAKRPPLPKICHIYPTMIKLGTVIPYLEKIQKIYESRDTPLEFC